MAEENEVLATDFELDENELLIGMLLSHKKEHLQQFLKDQDFPYSYTKEGLRKKVLEHLQNGEIDRDDLIRLLDRIEEFGNQHVYLFTNNSGYLSRLRDENYIRGILRHHGLDHMYNNSDALLIPEEPTIAAVTHTETELKIKWVEKRMWYELLEQKVEGDHLIKTYKINCTRGVTIFRVDLYTGNADLMIQQLPRGSNYERIRELYTVKLLELIDINTFSMLKLRSSIKRIEDSGQVERRQINYETIAGGKVTFKSRSRGVDYRSDPHLQSARTSLGDDVSGELGNFYWKPNDHLQRSIHTHIYGKHNHVGIFGECSEEEVNYVLSRVRHFAQTAS